MPEWVAFMVYDAPVCDVSKSEKRPTRAVRYNIASIPVSDLLALGICMYINVGCRTVGAKRIAKF